MSKILPHAILIDRSGAKTQVSLEMTSGALNVRSSDRADKILHSLSMTSLQLSLGGNSNKLMFIQSPQLAENLIYIEVSNQVFDLFAAQQALTSQVDAIKKEKHAGAWIGFSIAASFFLIVVGLIYFRAPIAGSLSQFIPFSLEQKLADQIFNPKLTEEQIVVRDSLRELSNKLQFSPTVWNSDFKIHISSEATPNAYATVGGHIFVNKGLITGVSRAEDLLGVVAHEMIHVTQRHVVKSVVQAVGVYSLLAFLVGDVSGLAAVLVDQGAPLLQLSYSRDLEEEADRMALELMVQNGIDPEGLANSLEMIFQFQKKLIDQSPGGEMLEKLQKIELLSSHPETEKRIAHLRKEAARYKESTTFTALDFDFASFQNQVKEKF